MLCVKLMIDPFLKLFLIQRWHDDTGPGCPQSREVAVTQTLLINFLGFAWKMSLITSLLSRHWDDLCWNFSANSWRGKPRSCGTFELPQSHFLPPLHRNNRDNLVRIFLHRRHQIQRYDSWDDCQAQSHQKLLNWRKRCLSLHDKLEIWALKPFRLNHIVKVNLSWLRLRLDPPGACSQVCQCRLSQPQGWDPCLDNQSGNCQDRWIYW